MPDPNKLAVFKLSGIHLAKCCGVCSFFLDGKTGWGSCKKFKYEHSKHKRVLQLPVHKTFVCPCFKRSEYTTKSSIELGEYQQIMEEE